MPGGLIVVVVDRRRADEEGRAGTGGQHVEDGPVGQAFQRVGLLCSPVRLPLQAGQVQQPRHLGAARATGEGGHGRAGLPDALQLVEVGHHLGAFPVFGSILQHPQNEGAVHQRDGPARLTRTGGHPRLGGAQASQAGDLGQVPAQVEQVPGHRPPIFVQVVLGVAQRGLAVGLGRLAAAVPVDQAADVEEVVQRRPVRVGLDL